VPHAELFVREVGQGQPVVVLHGGPDFNHTYLLPDLDRLSDAYRLIYYDQRGRGQSRGEWQLVTLQTEVDDLDAVLAHCGLESAAVLGHSWGGLLAATYALRRPARVSHLILMNTAPVSFAGVLRLRAEIARRTAPQAATLNALRSSEQFAAGDPATVAEFYRVRFRATTSHPERLARLDFGYGRCRAEDVQRALAVEERLYHETYHVETFDLLPALRRLAVPSLVLHGADDFVPVEVAAEIAQAIPSSRLVVLPDCGHFSYMECPAAVRQALDAFFAA
jgi:proline iminopeptidase